MALEEQMKEAQSAEGGGSTSAAAKEELSKLSESNSSLTARVAELTAEAEEGRSCKFLAAAG